MKFTKQAIVYTFLFIFNLFGLTASTNAAMIGADAIVAAQSRQDAESRIQQALARTDVAKTLESLGVPSDQVQERIAALSDEDVSRLSERIERLPAGGDFFGTVGAIFVILLITDILGFTKIFPFTRAQR